MITVGQLARRFGLSRSTLLYYSRIGLLCPGARSDANYRLYSEKDAGRLEAICRYRQAGLRLGEIVEILDAGRDRLVDILGRRLEQLNQEIGQLREQQRVVVRLLRSRARLRHTRALDKKRWVALLRASGLTEGDMRRWHSTFERMAPQAHQDFLESLGIALDEIQTIRRRSREGATTPGQSTSRV